MHPPAQPHPPRGAPRQAPPHRLLCPQRWPLQGRHLNPEPQWLAHICISSSHTDQLATSHSAHGQHNQPRQITLYPLWMLAPVIPKLTLMHATSQTKQAIWCLFHRFEQICGWLLKHRTRVRKEGRSSRAASRHFVWYLRCHKGTHIQGTSCMHMSGSRPVVTADPRVA